PQLPGYTVLKQALGRYRNIRERGGWPSLAAGPTLNPGDEGERVLILRWRLVSTGDLSGESLDSPVFDEELKEAVLRFQHRHYLEEDGLVGKQTLAALNQSIDEKIDQIRVNLERLRWLSHDKPDNCILIDIAGYTLTLHLGHDFTWSTRVVVGKPYHKTPTLAAAIKYLVINPTWTIPRSIFRNEVLPKIKKDSSYLQKENLQVVTPNGRVIPRSSINWYNHTGRSFPYLLRQTPGPHNALGRIKFIFPNKHSVYLHDTPHRKLFEKEQRAFSHGCIRVDKPLELAEIILKNDGQDWDLERLERVIASRKIKTVYLNQPLPIMLLYWTVNASDAQTVSFKHDVYGRDQLLLEALDGGFDPRRNIFQVPKWGEEVELHGSK
ncbi:MAG: L,D-transpeptidase family protein, partial [Thermodesulfobacteriota bacterium]